MAMTTTPLLCGHAFRAKVRPQQGERVWCHTCSDYRYVRPQRAIAGPSPRQVRLTCGHVFHASPPPLPGDLVRCHACRAYRHA